MIQYPLSAAGTLTRVLEAGDGDKSMLLVHGVGARADRWRRNLDGFADAGYRVFAVDLPGHGLAAKGTDFNYSVPGYASFILAVMQELGVRDVYLVGTSLGGHILATVACEIPNRVAGLVLIGTLGITPMGPAARQRSAGLIGDTSREMINRKLRTVMHDDTLVTRELRREEFLINNSSGAAETFAEVSAYFRDHIDDDVVGDRLAVVGRSIPILIVWGREDVGFPLQVGEAAHARLRGSHLAIMDNAAHAPYFERPGTFNTVVSQFIDGRLGDTQIDGVELRGP